MMVRSAIFNARGKQKKSLYRTLRAVREDSKEGLFPHNCIAWWCAVSSVLIINYSAWLLYYLAPSLYQSNR